MEIAEYLTLRPNLFAVAKHNLGNRDEEVAEFLNPSHFGFTSESVLVADEVSIQRKEVALKHDATFDVTVSNLYNLTKNSSIQEIPSTRPAIS